jgi:hypothetical protein
MTTAPIRTGRWRRGRASVATVCGISRSRTASVSAIDSTPVTLATVFADNGRPPRRSSVQQTGVQPLQRRHVKRGEPNITDQRDDSTKHFPVSEHRARTQADASSGEPRLRSSRRSRPCACGDCRHEFRMQLLPMTALTEPRTQNRSAVPRAHRSQPDTPADLRDESLRGNRRLQGSRPSHELRGQIEGQGHADDNHRRSLDPSRWAPDRKVPPEVLSHRASPAGRPSKKPTTPRGPPRRTGHLW